MAIINNKKLCVINETETAYLPLLTVNEEIFLTADVIAKDIYTHGSMQYIHAIDSPLTYRIIRVYMLNKDETIYRDISEFILNDWDLSFKFQQGQIRSGNITLINNTGEWLPSPVKNTIWKGTKYKILTGIFYNGVAYWKDCGIFVSGNPSIDNEKQIISVPLYDKFALLDGTIGGKRFSEFKIPVGSNIKECIELCLNEDKGNGEVFDFKPIIFPTIYSDEKTPYSITKDANLSMGDIIIELAEMINCYVSYDNYGNLNITPGTVTNDDYASMPVSWNYNESKGQFTSVFFDIDFESLINEIVVCGAIEGGKQYRATIINSSPSSQSNIYLTEPSQLYIEDSNLIGYEACLSKAKYEMIKQGRLSAQLKFKSIYIPHLECNNTILFTYSKLNMLNELFVINSITINSDLFIDISASNANEVIFR